MSNNYECLLIAALIASPELIGTVAVEPKVFTDTRYRAAFEVLSLLKNGDANPATICQELENKGWKNVETVKFVSTLVGIFPDPPGIDKVEFYAAKTNEAYGKRTLATKATSLLKEIRDPAVPLSENISTLGHLAVSAQQNAYDLKDPTGEGIVSRLMDQLGKGTPPSFPSGLTYLDAALASRGIKQGQVWFVVGNYGSFKSRTALHIADTAIGEGKSVCYFGLEDDELVYSVALMAAHFGIPERNFERHFSGEETSSDNQIGKAINWLVDVGKRWRVYDRAWNIGDWKRFAPAVQADKLKFGTNLVILDHVQLWATEYKDLAAIANMLMDTAQQAQVGLVVLSQVSNETMRNGAPANMLPTKGSGDFGAIAHVGFEVIKTKDTEFDATQPVLEALEANGTLKYLNKGKIVDEVGVRTRKIRKGNPNTFYLLFDPFSGKVLYQSTAPFKISLD